MRVIPNKYNKMSDFEINKLVYSMVFGESPRCHGEFIYHPTICSEYNPCSTPRDAWAIIPDSDIELTRHRIGGYKTGDYVASGMYLRTDCKSMDGYNEVSVIDANPMRAIMVCYLIMKDKEEHRSHGST